MRTFSALAASAWIVLALSPTSPASAQSASAEQAGPAWYVAAAGGASGSDGLGQEGWNRDDLCYPDMACFGQEPPVAISGYRWRYDIDLDNGAAFELAAGRRIGRARVELAWGQQRNDADQQFTALSFFDGSPLPPRPDSSLLDPRFYPPVDANAQTWIDRVNVRHLSLNAYYDFPGAWGALSPYLGAGLGSAQVEIAGLHYSSDYQDTGAAATRFDPPLAFYNSVQNADLKDNVLIWRLHAGVDYALSARTAVGLKLTWSGTRSFEVTAGYDTHAQHQSDPGFTNTNAFSGIRYWSAALTVKRLFGN